MKTKTLWLVIAVAAVMTSLSSCEKDQVDPIIIDSEVLDSGMDGTVNETETTSPEGVKGTSLSYQSWIMVRTETRATSENKISVTLNGVVNDVSKTIDVGHLQLGEMKTEIEYTSFDGREEKNIIVLDSALVYKVSFGELAFNYELKYEVPVYSDGVTTQTMPYHRVEFVKDNGYTVEYVNPTFDGLKIYACRLLKHSVTVRFNGKSYVVNAAITFRRLMATNGLPVVVSTEKLDEGSSIITCENNGRTPVFIYMSWVKMKHIWSDGKTSEVTYEQRGNPSIKINEDDLRYRILQNINLKLESTAINDGEMKILGGDNEYTRLYNYEKKFVIQYNYFSLVAIINEPIPVYDDGIIRYNMPNYVFNNMSYNGVLSNPTDDRVDGQEAYAYDLKPQISFSMGDNQLKLEDIMWLYVIK